MIILLVKEFLGQQNFFKELLGRENVVSTIKKKEANLVIWLSLAIHITLQH